MAADALQKIMLRKRAEVAERMQHAPLELLRERVAGMPMPRNFFQAVVAQGTPVRTRVIAEVKRKSPSAGLIRADFDPVDIAARYHAAGASAISCLTDEPDFGGRLEFIQQIREHVPLPVLRKDFIVDAWQIWESRAAGADAPDGRDLANWLREAVGDAVRAAEAHDGLKRMIREVRAELETRYGLAAIQVGGEYAVSAGEQQRQVDTLRTLGTCLAALAADDVARFEGLSIR